MKTIQIQSEVGKDGVLNLRVPMSSEDAAKPVLVTIAPIRDGNGAPRDETEWHRFVDETYGSCAGLGFERPDQGEFEERDELE
jgi:hypothetical protein